MGIALRLAVVTGLGVAGAAAAGTDVRAAAPEKVGACVSTTIDRIGIRPPTAATTVRPASRPELSVGYANAGAQISSAKLPELTRSRVDDKVEMCLVALPHVCPNGDLGGRLYRVTNQRTRETWTLPDPYHHCPKPR